MMNYLPWKICLAIESYTISGFGASSANKMVFLRPVSATFYNDFAFYQACFLLWQKYSVL